MLLHDFRRNRQSQAGSAVLGGIKRQKQPLANLIRKAVAGVGDDYFHGAAILAERGLNPHHAQQASLHGFGRVVDQVGQGAANRLRIGQHNGQIGLQRALHGDALQASCKKRQRLVDYLVDTAGPRLRGRKLRQRRELIHQRAQRAYASQDHFAASADDAWRVGLPAVEMPADSFGAERDGRERILDLVGHALGHFLPGQLALSAQQLSGVFDHQHRAGASLRQFQPGAGDRKVKNAPARLQLNLSGGSAHALAAANHGGQIVSALGGKSASSFSPARIVSSRRPMSSANARFDCSTMPVLSSVTRPLGNRLHDGFQLAPPFLDGLVGRGQLR